jgi:8-oxo-dGTP pyrophosphatase MutT (NUDIX family)
VKRDSEALRPPDPRLLSAGVVLVRPSGVSSRYLVLRAYRNWDFPKGVVEPGENPLDAAVREVREETSLDGLDFRWGHGFRETEPYARGKVARYYLAAPPSSSQVRLVPSPELGRPEHHEFRWAPRDEAARLLPPRLQPVLEWAVSLVQAGTATDA